MKNVIMNRAALPKEEPQSAGPWRSVYSLLAMLTKRVNDLSAGGLSVKIGPAEPINDLENLRCRQITLGGVTFTALTKD